MPGAYTLPTFRSSWEGAHQLLLQLHQSVGQISPAAGGKQHWQWRCCSSVEPVHGRWRNSGEKPLRRALSASQSRQTATTAPAAVTLAVLPFANLSSDLEQEYFSDGLTEEILNQLAQIQALRVTGRTSSFSFKGKNEDLRIIGKKLGVANLLEGSIRKNGNQLRINAQLISSTDGAHLWSQTYARELKDVFAIQEEIARDVARTLSIKLQVGDMSRAQGGTTNLEAYEMYLRAKTLRRRLDATNSFEVARLYRDAIALDPTFWRAWFGLRTVLSSIRSNVPAREGEISKELNEVRAHLIGAAPDSWSKQVMLADYYFEQRNWREVEAALKAAIRSMPASEDEGRISMVGILLNLGKVTEALAQAQRLTEIDPLTVGPSTMLSGALTFSGRFAEAQAEYARGRTLAGSYQGMDYLALQRLLAATPLDPKAIRNHLRSNPSSFQKPVPWQVLIDNLDSTPAERKAVIQTLLQAPENQNSTSIAWIMEFAEVYGDRDAALAAMRRTVSLGSFRNFVWMPCLSRLRSDPRFRDILRESGLVEYYRTTGTWGDFCNPLGTVDFECH